MAGLTLFSGYNPCSLVDYEGKVSFVAFTAGCNLRCRYCHNFRQCIKVSESSIVRENIILEEFSKVRKNIDVFVISGGEPTIYEDLPFFIRHLKTDFDVFVKLDTNGLNPLVLEQCLRNGLDAVSLDFKWPINDYTKFKLEFKKTLALLRSDRVGVSYEIRTTVHKHLLSPKDLNKIASQILPTEKWKLQLAIFNEDVLDKDLFLFQNYTEEELKNIYNSLRPTDTTKKENDTMKLTENLESNKYAAFPDKDDDDFDDDDALSDGDEFAEDDDEDDIDEEDLDDDPDEEDLDDWDEDEDEDEDLDEDPEE